MGNFIIEEEFNTTKIGTLHNTKRFIKIMTNMIKNPGKSIISQCSTRTDAKAAYQFLNNDRLNFNEIAFQHKFKTIERMVEHGGRFIIVHDGTSVSYNTQKKKEGLNNIYQNLRGCKVHTCIALNREGLNLGMLYQTYSSNDYRELEHMSQYEKQYRSIEEKESYVWLETFHQSNLLIPPDIDITVVSDREGDIYEYWAYVISHKRFFLTRVAQNRMTTENEKLFNLIRKEKSHAEIGVRLPRNTAKNVQSREARLEIRYRKVEIIKPVRLNSKVDLPKKLTVWVIYAKEINTPSACDPIEWFLVTNRPLNNVEEAIEQVKDYGQRWKIERFHYVLKTGGCNIEKNQARSMDVTYKIIMLYSIIAVFIMNLTYAARLTPDKPCSDYFEEEEWKVMYCLIHKTGSPPDKPYTIKEAVKYLATLGAGRRAPSDGDPGVKLIWQGLEKLYFLLDHKETIKLMVQV